MSYGNSKIRIEEQLLMKYYKIKYSTLLRIHNMMEIKEDLL